MSARAQGSVRGLPEPLPAGERLLWQGVPRWQTLARRAFHTPKLAIYFAVLITWRAASALSDGSAIMTAAESALGLLLLAVAALALLSFLAWLIGRSSVYTITDRRLVLQCGVALPMTLNIPFGAIESAVLKVGNRGTGDIAVSLSRGQRIAYLQLWPHVRPWRLASPQPMLRAIPDASGVADVLARALAATTSALAAKADVGREADRRSTATTPASAAA